MEILQQLICNLLGKCIARNRDFSPFPPATPFIIKEHNGQHWSGNFSGQVSKPKFLPRASLSRGWCRVGAEYGGKTNHDVSHFAAGQGEVVLKDTILDSSGHCAPGRHLSPPSWCSTSSVVWSPSSHTRPTRSDIKQTRYLEMYLSTDNWVSKKCCRTGTKIFINDGWEKLT